MSNSAGILDDLTDREVLDMAAKNLLSLAADLKASHTTSLGTWPDRDPVDAAAHLEHDLALALSARVAKIAKRYTR